jgi:hypothetical protein
MKKLMQHKNVTFESDDEVFFSQGSLDSVLNTDKPLLTGVTCLNFKNSEIFQ